MTGFGNARVEMPTSPGQGFVVEIKAVNSKFLDFNLRLPKDLSDKEFEVRTMLSNDLERGKVSVNIDRFQTAGSKVRPKTQLNQELFLHYYQTLKAAADQVGHSYDDLLRLVVGMPEVMTAVDDKLVSEEENPEWPVLVSACQQALQAFNAFRAQEGQMIADKLKGYVANIHELLTSIEQTDPTRIQATRQRILDRLEELKHIQIDKNRFEQELVYYIEKLDIAEEKTRLRNHLDYLLETLENGNGKKIGFICQEIGREINTIGSKVNEASIQRLVVEMKEELEKIREQSLNVL